MEQDDVGTTIKGYTLMQYIGGGAFGRVYKSIKPGDPQIYAVKVVRKNIPGMPQAKRAKLEKLLEGEIKAMSLCNSPNVVKIVERLESLSKIYIVMEYCDGPNLETHLKKGRLSEEQALLILRQLACGFKELQHHNIIHRDLKPANIFSNSGEFKLGDLGFARVMQKTEDMTGTMLGSLCYMAPELLDGRPYGFSVDLWSLGVVFHELLFGRRPFGGPGIGSFFAMLHTIKTTPLNIDKEPVSDGTKQLLRSMLTIDVEKRISWDDFYDHSLLAQENITISQFIPAVRRDPSSKDKGKTKDIKDGRDLMQQLFEDDKKQQKKIVADIKNKEILGQFQKQFQEMESRQKTFSKNTEKLLFELSKLNILVKYVVSVGSKLDQELSSSRSLTEIRMMVAARCFKKAFEFKKFFQGKPSIFELENLKEYRETTAYKYLEAQNKFIYQKCMSHFKEIQKHLFEKEESAGEKFKDFFKKRFQKDTYEQKDKLMSGLEDFDFSQQEHTRMLIKLLKENAKKLNKLSVSRQGLAFLIVMKNYESLACFKGQENSVEKITKQLQKAGEMIFSGKVKEMMEGLKKDISEI